MNDDSPRIEKNDRELEENVIGTKELRVLGVQFMFYCYHVAII